MKEPLTPEKFAMVCFLVLMQNGQGILDKHPDYIEEKQAMLTDGYDAFGRLDYSNMAKVIEWHTTWEVKLADEIQKYIEDARQLALDIGIRLIWLHQLNSPLSPS